MRERDLRAKYLVLPPNIDIKDLVRAEGMPVRAVRRWGVIHLPAVVCTSSPSTLAPAAKQVLAYSLPLRE